jgi:nucleoside-diphosphate-sugar epimerase
MDIFITGATGYIGGSLAERFMSKGHTIRGLVRSREKAEQLSSLGIEPVLGNLDDADVLRTNAATADAVINAASSDHQGAVEALLAGLEGSDKPFLHTSGAGKMTDNAGGEYRSDRVYDEDAPFTPLPARAPRHALDQLVRDAASRGVRSAVICPR